MHARNGAVNMSKSCRFTLALAVICLPVILLSSEADAQSTVDDGTCSSALGDEIAQEMIRKMHGDVKKLLQSNPGTNDCTAGGPSLVSALVCECHIFCQFHIF